MIIVILIWCVFGCLLQLAMLARENEKLTVFDVCVSIVFCWCWPIAIFVNGGLDKIIIWRKKQK